MADHQDIREFVIHQLATGQADISGLIQSQFGISRQAASKHLKRLVSDGLLVAEGSTRARRYGLASERRSFNYELSTKLAEDRVWREDVAPLLDGLPQNVLDIWQYTVTEMVNNAIDHSGGNVLSVAIERSHLATTVRIFDDGIGIFRKIREALNLDDIRHAVLELAKGKFTTDPQNHSGEGIFFASRAVDEFTLIANGLFAVHEVDGENDWILDDENEGSIGTRVRLELANDSKRDLQKVFDQYSSPDDDYVFTRTVIPVNLVRYGNERVVSRSQAKRLLARVERFSTVVFDFAGIESIGQAFADEIFRVFARAHPDIELISINATEQVSKMIRRAEAA